MANGTRTRDPQIHNLVSATQNERANNDLRRADFSVAHPVAHELGISTVVSAAEPSKIDPDLAVVNAAWPTLPTAIRAGIVAMIEAAGR